VGIIGHNLHNLRNTYIHFRMLACRLHRQSYVPVLTKPHKCGCGLVAWCSAHLLEPVLPRGTCSLILSVMCSEVSEVVMEE